MKDMINQFLGQQGGQAVQMIGALLVVVVLIVLFAWIMRRLSGNKAPAPRRGERQTQRLAVVDAAHVDGQRRLVLVRRDDVEHLVMIGGPNDVLIEPRIMRGQPLGGQRQPSQMAQPVAQAAPPPMAQPMPAAMQPPPQPAPMRVNTAPQPVSVEPAVAPPQPVPMPPPFIEPVTSPASSARANPIAADLRAAMSDPRRDDYQNTAPTRMAPPRPQAPPPPAPDYATGGDTMAIGPGARGGFRPEPAPQPYPPASPQPYPAVAQPRPTSRPSPSQPTLEDMVAAGLEEAISRPDPTPPRAPAPPRSGASNLSFGQRAETSGDPRRDAPSRDAGRSTAKDPMAAEIEKAIYGLTAAPAGRNEPPPHRPAPPTFNAPRREPEISREPPSREPPRREPPRREPAPARDAFYRAPPPPEPAREATRPIQNRTAPPAAGLRPTLVANQDGPGPEPVVAVMPSPETVRSDLGRSDGRRTSSEIEDEMARLLSELTGTSGR